MQPLYAAPIRKHFVCVTSFDDHLYNGDSVSKLQACMKQCIACAVSAKLNILTFRFCLWQSLQQLFMLIQH